jgi:hypothetical protein
MMTRTKTKQTKISSKLFFLCIQQSSGRIVKILSGDNYDILLMRGMSLSKEVEGFWTIFNAQGRLVDGNFADGNLPPKRR